MKRLLVLVAAAALSLGLMASPAVAYDAGNVHSAGCVDGKIVDNAGLYDEQLAPAWSLLAFAVSYDAPGCVREGVSWDGIAIAVNYGRIGYGGPFICGWAYSPSNGLASVAFDATTVQVQEPKCTDAWPAGFNVLEVFVSSETHGTYTETWVF